MARGNNSVTNVADELHREIGEPTDYGQGIISLWLRANIGQLNNLIHSSYIIDNSAGQDISPELGDGEKAILKELFFIYYYGKQINSNLGAAAYDAVIEVQSDGARVRKVNKNEVAKSYLQLREQHKKSLKDLLNGYRYGSATPIQVAGDDDLSPDPYSYEDGESRRGD